MRLGQVKYWVVNLWLLLLFFAMPLLGTVMHGHSLGAYLVFPFKARRIDHHGFSWMVFILLAAVVLVPVVLVQSRIWRTPKKHVSHLSPVYPWPWWGTVGILMLGLSWFLAWTRQLWFEWGQLFTFFPLWFSFILVLNALTYRRSGRCLLMTQPKRLLGLFGASALFWWGFEYLNQFVDNWHYLGLIHLPDLVYGLNATLCFSTVLPAVASTRNWLATFPHLGRGLNNAWKVTLHHPRLWACLGLGWSYLGMVGLALWPDYLFPLLWLAPAGAMMSLQVLRRRSSWWTDVKKGHWRELYLWAVAALGCGFLWELWNSLSLAKWVYTVPWVDRYHLFEMPLLGYAGYLFFGLECALVIYALWPPSAGKIGQDSSN